ncbi:MIP/aquaporin family protein [Paenibacillus cremeus]|uniref:Aquaporin n=1 Tax=Paenibacillus cremeus TaxID=2163881 RepID=A0A559K6B3_9BACL|nr:aquaporin [Paenibacillus cremeus]TVY07643.1 aquaporin [Paenibacillus cremeus]
MQKKFIAEFIGTYFLVFAGPGAMVIDDITKSITHVGVALTFGLVVMALIYTFGHISGAHFNPAVTIGFWVRGDITPREGLFYIVTQFAAAVAASCTLRMLFGNVSNLGATLPLGTESQSFVLEFILTFILMLVILGSAVHGKAVKSFAGIAIGGTVGLMAMFAGPICGASMNPARSLGPAIVSGATQHLWLYLVATVLGAVAATLVYKLLHE